MPQSHDDIRVHQNHNPVSFLPGRSADGATAAPIFRVGNPDTVVKRIRNFSEFSAASINAAADIARIHTVGERVRSAFVLQVTFVIRKLR